jgi:hypothetical protein
MNPPSSSETLNNPQFGYTQMDSSSNLSSSTSNSSSSSSKEKEVEVDPPADLGPTSGYAQVERTEGHISETVSEEQQVTDSETVAATASTPTPTPPVNPSAIEPPPSEPPPVEGEQEYYWNERFQEALAMPDSLIKYERLASIANDFQLAAKTAAQLIVSELALPDEKKTIKPSDSGGFAGGVKYTWHNIFFKFALDTDLNKGKNKDPRYVYGREKRADHNAIKAASHDLKSATSLLAVRPPHLCLPLMVLVDYRGYRLSATSLLPLNDMTLVYGSNDGGRFIHNDNYDVMGAIRKAMTALNLSQCKKRTKFVWGPFDLEGHLGLVINTKQ